jgi:HSP20 family protein
MFKDLIPWKKRSLSNQGRASADWFEDLHRSMNELFDAFSRDFPTIREPGFGGISREFPGTPEIDLVEDDKNITVTADLPGLDEKNIHVELDGGLLTISGEKTEEKTDKNATCHVVERRSGRFQRSIPVPRDRIDPEKIKARMKNGVLKLTIPKIANESAGKRIEVKVD